MSAKETGSMPGDELRVVAAHLTDLAVRQGRAAADIRSATLMAEGVDGAVRQTHGAVASASTSALAAVLAARRSAGERMAAISDDLCDKLTGAAKRYDGADDGVSAILRGEMRDGQT